MALPYVVSMDIRLLLGRWADQRKFALPADEVFQELRSDFESDLRSIVPSLELIEEQELLPGLRRLVTKQASCTPKVPPVYLDRVYNDTGPSSYRLDITRYEGHGPARRERARTLPLDHQFYILRGTFEDKCIREINLVDDVLFEGKTLEETVTRFRRYGVRVRNVIVGISTATGRLRMRELGVEVISLREYEQLVDQVCERDFWIGVPYSGRSMESAYGIASVPYLWPHGKSQWASIPEDSFAEFSIAQKRRCIRLFEAIERCSGREVLISDLDRRPALTPCLEKRLVDVIEMDLKRYPAADRNFCHVLDGWGEGGGHD